MHECLRSHRSDLSESCRKEELALEELEAENVELRPGVMRVCKQERLTFCRGVVPGGARMFRCAQARGHAVHSAVRAAAIATNAAVTRSTSALHSASGAAAAIETSAAAIRSPPAPPLLRSSG